MVFSSLTFIYYFLPILLVIYYLSSKKYRNLILLIFSLAFYFLGEGKYIIILLLSSIINYLFGLLLDKKKNKTYLIIAIIFNLGMLCYFKYTNFLVDNINMFFNSNIVISKILLPIGISFFTFQTLSYVIDVYYSRVKVSKNIIDFMTYVCLFPQLVAGPIVRYSDVYLSLENRSEDFNTFSLGVRRFIIGLGKKVLIANIIGQLCTTIQGFNEMTVLSYIILAIGYTIQIYFDFSGYSDMAIGLGRMFGFKFLENFNYPLTAISLTDFWRRWHISLSQFFRDYVYIPLGGNRVSKPKFIRNIMIVWFLTGLWHGANYNFIIWGLYFGILLLIEKFIFKDFFNKHKIIGHIYTIILVIISFIIFSTDNISNTFIFIKSMFGLNNLNLYNKEILFYLKDYFFILVISIIGLTPLFKNISNKYQNNKLYTFLENNYLFIIFVVSTAYLVDSSFNPFLYFRF